MTSTPVSAGIKSFFPGPQSPQTSTASDVDSSFSDVLKNQKNDTLKDGEQVKTDKSANQTKPERRAEKISPGKNRDALQKKGGEPETEDAAVETQEAVQAAAAAMVTQTAQELNITEDEVVQLLDGLSMTPVDLLNTENLQQVVLANAGETDATVLVTDEALFSDFKDLTEALSQIAEQVAAETGVEPTRVQEIFTEAANRITEKETPVEQIEIPEETVELTEAKTARTEEEKPVKEFPEADRTETQAVPGQIETEKSDGQEDGGNGAEKKDHSEKENVFSPVAANETFREAPVSKPENVEAPRFSEETEHIMDQITDYMKGQVKEGMSELEMQLHPESLGTLHIRLTAKDGAVTAQFTAQNDTVKAVLEGQMIQLKENFKEQGITVEAIEVAVESHRFDENLQQDSRDAQSDQRQPARPRARRINLNVPGGEEDLTAEEQLAAEVLRANGGTVDYQA